MSKSGGVFQIDDVTRAMSKGGGCAWCSTHPSSDPPIWVAGYGPALHIHAQLKATQGLSVLSDSCLSEGNFVLVSISKDMKNSANIDNDITKSEKHIFTHRETVTSRGGGTCSGVGGGAQE